MRQNKNIFCNLILAAGVIVIIFCFARFIPADFFSECNFNCVIDFSEKIGTAATAIGVIAAYRQLTLARNISVAQFEGQLFIEYRRVIEKIPSSFMLGGDISDNELIDLADKFYMYIDLTNEQIHLRMSGKITKDTWIVWRDGIHSNLSRTAFKKSWDRIKISTSNFQELRRLECEGFMSDPISWGKY